ncbi:MAG: NTP transferase domain-containing protein [Rhodobacterales bacterium]|nr:NTP transferase domain-containing protein [Rhodobacterales bacterium]
MNGAVPTAWALVPARGGSKSIRLKNLVPLAGRPLLDYGIRAVQAAGCCARIICSTDHPDIAARALHLGAEVDPRPEALATDDANVNDVARDLLARLGATAPLPEWIVLIQPTSPFLLPGQVTDLLAAAAADPEARSGQTIAKVPHNHHAWNQRDFAGGRTAFHYAAERARGYNKQLKPALHVFGNLVITRASALLAGDDFFAQPSVGRLIARPYDMDVDGPEDVVLAEALIAAGAVDLSFLDGTP